MSLLLHSNGLRLFARSSLRLPLRTFIGTPKLFNRQLTSQHKETPKRVAPEARTEVKSSITDNIYTLPNFLTATRIVSAPLVGYFIVKGENNLAISLFSYSCITDFLDGYIARRFKMQSIMGTILDPIADKLLMGICTIALSAVSIMPAYLAAIIIGKDAMLALMGTYWRYTTLPPPKTLSRLANLSIPTVKVEPNLFSKVNTGLQMVYIGNLVFKSQLETLVANYDVMLNYYEIFVAVTTIISGMSYIFSSRSVKLLGPK